jgi:integrase
MANLKVSLMRYCKTPNGWKRYPAVIGKNGRGKPGFVSVEGRHVFYPEGHYEIRYYDGSKVKYQNVGTDAQEALAACAKHGKVLIARETATEANAIIVEEPGRMNLSHALVKFIQGAEHRGALVAAKKYKHSADEFLSLTNKRFADEIVADDLLRFQGALRKRKLSDRTIANHHSYLSSFLRSAGVNAAAFPSSAPKYEKTLPEVYTSEQLQGFFASLDDLQHVVTFQLALKCGLREQELMHVQWSDVNFAKKTVLVRSKLDWGFKVKDKEERSMPIPDDVMELLVQHRAHRGGQLFITGTSGNRPNTHLLRMLKRLVDNAGLGCGDCTPCRERNECQEWFLHKFRASYATALLRNGLDIRSVQKLMGHSDMESTMRYLRPSEDAVLQDRVNAIVW